MRGVKVEIIRFFWLRPLGERKAVSFTGTQEGSRHATNEDIRFSPD